jgi:hypothetical protein
MKIRLVLVTLAVGLGLFLTSKAESQQLQFIVVNGAVNPPAILQSSLPANQRPTVQRLGAGFYRFTFRTNVLMFNGHAQRGGVGGDASLMLLASTFHTNNPRLIDVHTFVLTPGAHTSTTHGDARLSIVFTR